MKRILFTTLFAVIAALMLYAQEDSKIKILVFRNSGEITIFDSDSISKVELSNYDADSVFHEQYFAQVFHNKKNNQSTAIPLAEIDSVAFGYRNIVEPKKGARRLTDAEVEAIYNYDGEVLEYDSRLKLTAGELVYHDCITKAFPAGLCARINNVREQSEGYKAELTMVDVADVFDRYLVTGDASLNVETKKAKDYSSKPFEFEISNIGGGKVDVEGKIQVNIDCEATDIVADFVNKYYHANIKLFAYPRADISVNTSETQELNKEFPEDRQKKPRIIIPALANTVHFDITLDAFIDLLAEAGIHYEFGQEYAISIDWTRQNGVNTFSTPTIEPSEVLTATQKTEVHLNGEVFLGLRLDASINTIFEFAGAGVELKVGPRLSGELGLGVLQEFSERFNQEAYGKAAVELEFGLKTETYYYRVWRDPTLIEKVKLPYESEFFAHLHTFNIFPEFNTKAVLARETSPLIQRGNESEAVSVSTFLEEELAYPLNISFEIADRNTDKTLAESEVIDTFEAGKESYQNSSSEIPIPAQLGKVDKDNIVARPIIRYKGYKIKTKAADVSGDMFLSPYICTLSTGNGYFISGMTPVSQQIIEGTTYIEGNLIGILRGDPRHKKKKFTTIDFVELSNPQNCKGSDGINYSLLGCWAGIIAGENVKFDFLDEENGLYNGNSFTYRRNSPYKGSISIVLDDIGTITFSVVDISEYILTILMKGSSDVVVLTRQ